MSAVTIKVSLPEICELVTDGTHDSPKLQPSGVPFIKGKHISSGRIDFEACDFITEQDHSKCIQRVKPRTNDVLFSNIGSVGDVARVSNNIEFSIKNVALFRPSPEKVDPLFFYYLVSSSYFREHFLNVRSGSAQPFISLESFRTIEFNCLQDRTVQERIGHILSAYDDLIENNRRRIQLLEQAARLLYKEWFVRLRFPGHEHVKVKDGVPEGWTSATIADIGQVVTGKTPSKKRESYYGDDIPFIKTPDMHGSMLVVETEESLSKEGANTQTTKTLPPRSILVSCIGTVGVVSLNSSIAQTNQQINAIVPTDESLRYWTFFMASGLKSVLEGMSGGATMANVNKAKFSSIEVIIPSPPILSEFNSLVASHIDQIEQLALMNIRLTQARDLLLPRLMNGKMISWGE